MKTIAKITLIVCLFGMPAFVLAQNYNSANVMLHHNGNVSLFTEFTSAYINANNGDTIYLPAGNFSFTMPEHYMMKKLTVIGAGHHPDSTGATGETIINTEFIFYNNNYTSNAAGSIFTGIDFWSNLRIEGYNNPTATPYPIRLNRCRFSVLSIVDISPYYTEYNTEIEECVIAKSYFNFGYEATGSFDKNIFVYNKDNYFNAKGNFCNNIFYVGDTMPFFDNVTFRNNIFVSNGTSLNMYNVNSCHFENNLFCSTTGQLTVGNWGNNTYTSNYEGYTAESVFVDANNFINSSSIGNVYTNNFHLKSNVVGILLGQDGTQVGLYGTTEPFKDGSVPFNPHIGYKYISTQTNNSGNLNVKLKVTSQDR